MGKPVNLNQARKARDKARKKAQADENAARFGRTRAERLLEETREKRAREVLDQHRKDT